MRHYYIAGNWKMNTSLAEAASLATGLVQDLSAAKTKIMIAPPFTAMHIISALVKDTNIILGAQNMGPELQGAHTGEVSVLMLKEFGVRTVILGHSERRHSYMESDALINKKVLLALSEGMEVILCVGETLEERDAGRLETVIATQLRSGLKNVASLERVVIAYEPVWAIGTGKTATPADADTVHAYIRTVITELYGAESAKTVCIQYGGSVKADNAAELLAMPNIDGALVGGAALKRDSFTAIAAAANARL